MIDQPARLPSEEKTRPSEALPVLSCVLVCGPPASAWLNEPNVMPYLDFRPGWQNGRCGHSAGPASTDAVPLHLAAKSLSVLRPYLSANAFVVANAFWSVAADGVPKVRPALVPSSFSAVIVALMSPLALGAASLPFCFWLRNSVSVAAYSGKTLISPRSSAASYSSRLPTVWTVALNPAALSAILYSSARVALS